MKSTLKIGRENSNDIVINEPRISRNHAIVTDLGNGTFEVKDLGSTNGTFVNGQRITTQIIRQSDKLEVAGCLVKWFEVITSPKEEKTAINEQPFAKILKTITIGASPENNLVIQNNFVSAHHAKISLLKNGDYFIQDLGSSNGTFINGIQIMAKNFAKTDVVKIASANLPVDWFHQKNLTPRFFKDHRKKLLISFLLLTIASGSILYCNYSCKWFNCNCNLSANEINSSTRNCIVHIEHSYYYTIQANGKKYYIGRNKQFGVVEANPDNQNLLPYGKITGSGCIIKSDGTILTSSTLIAPWLFNEQEKSKMLSEVSASKTIDNFSSFSNYPICGETIELKWLPNNNINNAQNYINATASNVCSTNDVSVTIHSVKNILPRNTQQVEYFFNPGSKEPLHKTDGYYYCMENALSNNSLLKDTLLFIRDTININLISSIAINKSLPKLPEGSAVFNERGELIGLVQHQKVELLSQFLNQIK